MSKFVAYYRVSTQKQGQSGLGLEAQNAIVASYIARQAGVGLIAEYTEVETGKGANALARRPQLAAALAQCKREGAVLLIAKLDRLARNVHFISGLIETGVDFIAADMPHANKVMIQMHAVMSEWERDQISKRTKEALAAAKARGVKLGVAGARNLQGVVKKRIEMADTYALTMRTLFAGMRAEKLTQRAMVERLNAIGVKTQTGKEWKLSGLNAVLQRIDRLASAA